MNNNKIRKEIDLELVRFLKGKISNKKSDLKTLYSLSKDYVLSGGKRLRPIAMVMAYQGVRPKIDKKIIRASIAVELYHASTLIHDDIMDEDEKRRGADTVFKSIRNNFLSKQKDKKYNGPLFSSNSKRYAVSQGILAGNIMQTLAIESLTKSGFPEKRISKAVSELVSCIEDVNIGQVLDTAKENDTTLSENEYFEIIFNKTARLFISSIKIGLILAGAKDKQIRSMSRYAENIGLAFQIKDDLMDISKDSQKGHELGSDIKQGKMTLIMINALKRVDKKRKTQLLRCFGNAHISKGDMNKAIEVVESCNAIVDAEALLEKLTKKSLVNLQKSKLKTEKYFEELSYFVSNRNI